MDKNQRNKIEALLVKRGFNEQGMTKGLYIIPDGRNISADIRGENPIVGVAIAGMIHATGHGINAVQDIQNEVAAIMKFKSPASEQKGSNPASGGINKAPELKNQTETTKGTKLNDDVMKGTIPSESKLGAGDKKASATITDVTKAEPLIQMKDDQDKNISSSGQRPMSSGNTSVGTPYTSKKGTTTAICPICNVTINGTIELFRNLQDKYGAIYCQKCGDRTSNHETETTKTTEDQKVAGNVPATPAKPETKPMKIPKCHDCGIEVPHAKALECLDQMRPATCDDCDEKHDETKHQETKDAKDAKVEEREARPEEPNEKIIDTAGFSLLEYLKSYVNNDVLEIFGDSGTGKSKFAVEVARQTIAAGKTVFYLDTERNLSKEEVEKLKGCSYKYTPLISEISTITRQLPKVDLVIVDSIGFPILTAYARMNMKQKGDALLNMIAIFGDLKEWAYRNNSIAIVINQPESDFNKAPDHLIRPFGDKSQFAAKEIWKTEITQRGAVTKSDIRAFRSRSVGHKTLIAKMEVSDSGTDIRGVRSWK